MAPKIKFLEPKHEYKWPKTGWCRRLEYDGVEYLVGVESGGQVRIPYTPRGTYGHKWYGFVRLPNKNNWTLFYERVGGTLGANGLLEEAGIIPKKAKQ
jgi:hypothetical protein